MNGHNKKLGSILFSGNQVARNASLLNNLMNRAELGFGYKYSSIHRHIREKNKQQNEIVLALYR